LLVVIIVACAACAQLAGKGEPAACAPAELAKIEAAYLAEGIDACKGKTPSTCTALPAIEAKYAAKREEWISCR
jgi:hypothetical protein